MDVTTRATLALRDYQNDCLDAIEAAWRRQVWRQLITLPTGAGKTIVFAQRIAAQDSRAIVLVHRDELVQQSIDKLIAAGIGRHEIGVVKAGRNDVDARIVVASIQTLAHERRLRQIVPDFAIVVADEAHHARARTWLNTLRHLCCFEDDGPLLLGFTATPDRADGSSIADVVFQEQVFQRSIIDLMQNGYLCDASAITVRAAGLDLRGVHTSGGDFRINELAAALEHANAPNLVVAAYQEHATGRKPLVFTPTVALAYATAERFRAAGIAAEALDGATRLDERRAILQRLKSGQTLVLVNCGVLTEGFDEPSIDCIMLARPTKSRALYTQMVGRGLRLHPGKADCLIVDLAGNAGRHDIATVPEIFGIPGRELTTAGSVAGVLAARERAQQAAEAERAARLVAHEVDLFRRRVQTMPARPRLWPGASLHWVAVGKYSGVVVLPSGFATVHPVQGGWAATAYRRDVALEVLIEGCSLGEAIQAAEALVRRQEGAGLALAAAAWRRKPASDKQCRFARRMGIQATSDMTAGALSDGVIAHQATQLLLRRTA